MHTRFLSAVLAGAVIFLLGACTQAPQKPATETKAAAEASKPAEPVAAQTAFFEMYKPARAWAKDIAPLSLVSGDIPGFKNTDGKAALWTAVFVSPSLQQARTLTYGIADHAPDIHKGVDIGGTEPWSGDTPNSQSFLVAEFSVNSDAAFKTASAKAEAWLTKHPDMPVSMALGKTSHFSGPVWYIQWGTKKLGYAAYVNATTGDYIK
jgi:hypothetical protein